MIVYSKREANRMCDLLYNYTTEKKDDTVTLAINQTIEFFKLNGNTKHVDLIENYFRDYYKYSKSYTDGGIVRYVCNNVINCSHTSGYDYKEDILNRFGYELAKAGYF